MIAPNEYALIRFTDGMEYPCAHWPALAPEEWLQRFTDRQAIDAACKALRRAVRNDFAACYVIGEPGSGRSKIGFSREPLRRIDNFRLATGLTLDCFALFWGYKDGARALETAALRMAAKHGAKLHGEWVGIEGHDAVGLVLNEAVKERALTDSGMFLDRWMPRMAEPKPINPRRAATSVQAFYEWAAKKTC